MNQEDVKIDKLTRDLMEGTAEQPSLSLMSRIMARVMGERKKSRKIYVKRLPSLSTLFSVLIVYLLIVGGGFYLLYLNPESVGVSEEFKHFFPILLTIAAGISFALLFSQLDKWLFAKAKHKEQK